MNAVWFRWCIGGAELAAASGRWLRGCSSYWAFLPKFFLRVELVWQEGLLLDFLQKTTCDLWMRKFLIYAAYLFNERWLFDKLIRFFLDFIIWPLHYNNIFDTLNIMWVLIILIWGFGIFFNIILLLYLYLN